MRGRGLGTPWWQVAALVSLAALTVVLCYLALTRDTTVSDASAVEPSASASSGDPSSFGDEPADDLPTVPDQRRADFTQGDDLADGRFRRSTS